MLEEFFGLFILGLVTFLSPCSIALITVYLTYAVGVSKNIGRGFIIGCSFALAMCLVFFLLGYIVSSLFAIDRASYRFFFGVAGLLLILFGISNLGFFKKIDATTHISQSFTKRANALRLNALNRFSKYNYAVGSFLFGVVISLALGPCSLSLVLPAILLTMFSASTPIHGGLLLLAFGLGHSLPVIFLSGLLATARKFASGKTALAGELLTKVFGAVFIVIGIVIVFYFLGGLW